MKPLGGQQKHACHPVLGAWGIVQTNLYIPGLCLRSLGVYRRLELTLLHLKGGDQLATAGPDVSELTSSFGQILLHVGQLGNQILSSCRQRRLPSGRHRGWACPLRCRHSMESIHALTSCCSNLSSAVAASSRRRSRTAALSAWILVDSPTQLRLLSAS